LGACGLRRADEVGRIDASARPVAEYERSPRQIYGMNARSRESVRSVESENATSLVVGVSLPARGVCVAGLLVCDQAVRSVGTGFQRDVYLPSYRRSEGRLLIIARTRERINSETGG
jgi:hypothetical protein